MDAFGYLSVLISIVLGLGIAQLLTGVGRILQARGRVSVYWPSLWTVVLLLIVHVQTWWTLFGLRGEREWTFVGFAIVLLQPILLYLMSVLVLPERGEDGRFDLRANYYEHSRWLFGLFIVLLLGSLAKDLILSGRLPGGLNLGVHVVFLVACAIAAVTRRERYHQTLSVVGLLAMLAYIALLFAKLS